ncbi:MAG: acylneuraminate cytidylyltransferase family protein [Campylobacter sp.]|nr:acylneuraminate cytidylyltransferase family protein [Campylobacter sp.]
MNINVFLPCRKGSQRVPNKNTKEFGGAKYGLLEIKLNQLLKAKYIDKIFISSDDDIVLNFADKLKNPKISIHQRDAYLASNQATADDLISHAYNLIQDDTILWTHVTSPFFDNTEYDKAILKYQDCLKNGYDSLMSVTALKGFFWYENKPINYDRNTIKWPPTQDTMPLYEINSAVFIADSQIYKTKKDRIGQKPFLFETDKIKSIDIDWKEDFIMADILYKTLIKKDKEMYRGGVAALNNPKYAPQQDLCLRGAI